MARLVFVAVFLAAVSAAADAQPLRHPPNVSAAGCLKLNTDTENLHWGFQTVTVQPAGADRVSVRFMAENRCQTAIRVMGGLREDGRTIQQRGPIEIHALRMRTFAETLTEDDEWYDYCRENPDSHTCTAVSAESIGKGSLQSFVVQANETVAVDGLVMLAAGAVPADVAVVIATYPQYGASSAYIEGEFARFNLPPDTTAFCIHYADRRCGEYQ